MRKILLPLDGSPLAEQAIPHVLAQLHAGDRVVLLRATDHRYLKLDNDSVNNLADIGVAGADEYLARVGKTLKDHGLLVDKRVLVDTPREAILAVAREEQPDLILMSSHGYSGDRRFLLGSVAESVARHAPCPVWLVRCHELSEPKPIATQRALVALDTRPLAERGLDFAVDWLRVKGAELVLYCATGLSEPEQGGWSPGASIRREMVAEARDYLARVAQRLEERGWKTRQIVEDEPAAAGILDAANREGADLIVLSSHGRTGLDRWAMGSVAERVFRHAECPVLLVNPQVPVSPVCAVSQEA